MNKFLGGDLFIMKKKLNNDGSSSQLFPFCWVIVIAGIFFSAAGRLDIFRAWLFFSIYLMGTIVGTIIMWRFAPGLANQLGSIKEGTKNWDKAFLIIYFVTSVFICPIVAGLDVGRFRWSQLGITYAIVGIVLYIACIALCYWAMVVNEHFEATVRIQKDRMRNVITGGPYRFVRHPGNLSMIFGSLSASFVIGSLYSLIPCIVVILVIVIRTHFEDRTLKEELQGYLAYIKITKHKLLPGVW
jgi:protein-S-isoprenylcysteine O-methyltransferase Ste14